MRPDVRTGQCVGAAPAIGIAAQTTKAAQTDTATVLLTQAPFPGIWDIATWTQYRAMQAAFLQGGHQPWLLHSSMVVSAWAASLGWQPTPAVHQVSPNVFQVVKPGTTITYTIQGTCPDPASSAPIWVITSISHS